MLILPAIDLIGGECVRLKQGAEDTKKIYNSNPGEQAAQWQKSGGQFIHVVNLDGAFGRAAANVQAIKNILLSVDIPIELGGGIRSYEDAQGWLNLGVQRVIFGTVAITSPQVVEKTIAEYGPERVVIGIDGRDNKVAIDGWETQTQTSIPFLAEEMKKIGAERIIYTDVARDGEDVGPNIKNTIALADEVQLNIIASGGFSTYEHFQELQDAENPLIEGAIVGTALYENKLDLTELVTRFQ